MSKTPEQVTASYLGVPTERIKGYAVPFEYTPEGKVHEKLRPDPEDGQTCLMAVEVDFPDILDFEDASFLLNSLHRIAYDTTYDAKFVVYPVVKIEDLV